MKNLPEKYSKEIGEAYTRFEKQRGGGDDLENVLLEKRRAEYEPAIASNPYDYDAWFDLAQLEESSGDKDRVRTVYDRATRQKPRVETKEAWKRYIYLWIKYAIWEEIGAEDQERAAKVYRSCLASIPRNHSDFSFGKVWVLAAELEIRRKQLSNARRILGNALGLLPHKHSLYRKYIKIELNLTEVDRARILYRKWIERNTTVSDPYIEYASMEEALGEVERAREILEIGVSMSEMDVPETIWKAYIDMEIRGNDEQKAVDLYERLLRKSNNVNVWLSYAELVSSVGVLARDVYKRGHRYLKEKMLGGGKNSTGRADVALLLDSWLSWEKEHGDDESLAHVTKLVPNRVKRKRPILDSQGNESGWEEYVEYVFAEERVKKPQLKILEFARSWKARELGKVEGGS